MDNIITVKEPAGEPDMQEDLDVDGVMMTRPSNMSSENFQRNSKQQLI